MQVHADLSQLVRPPVHVHALLKSASSAQTSLATWPLSAALRLALRLQHLMKHQDLLTNETLELSSLGLDTAWAGPALNALCPQGQSQGSRSLPEWPQCTSKTRVPVSAFQVAATAPHSDLISPFRAGEQVSLPTVALVALSAKWPAAKPRTSLAQLSHGLKQLTCERHEGSQVQDDSRDSSFGRRSASGPAHRSISAASLLSLAAEPSPQGPQATHAQQQTSGDSSVRHCK